MTTSGCCEGCFSDLPLAGGMVLVHAVGSMEADLNRPTLGRFFPETVGCIDGWRWMATWTDLDATGLATERDLAGPMVDFFAFFDVGFKDSQITKLEC